MLRFALVLSLATALFAWTPPARAQTEVDLALVIAVDVSNSMDPEEQDLQREGFVAAFRSPLVHEAIRGGTLGRISVTYLEWASTSHQYVTVPWSMIEDPEGATAFAERLAGAQIRRAPRTSVSGAIDFSMRMLDQSGVEPLRKVIDVSGDGANNQGRAVTLARDEAIAKDITINGLPIMLKRANSYWDVEQLDIYYRDCVIGGPGAFMIPIRDRAQFAEAIKTKIIREIADLRDPHPLVQKAQAESRTGCLAGENPMWERWRN
jgi:hypothetical protein